MLRTIYGDPERLPLTEDLPRRPVSVYGRSKAMTVQSLFMYPHQIL
jgi:UDP-glucose 4-epimerase